MKTENNINSIGSFDIQPLLNFITRQYDGQEVVNTLDQVMADQVSLMGKDEHANTKQIAEGYQLLRGMKQAIAAGLAGQDKQD